jgi:hypothetical protein
VEETMATHEPEAGQPAAPPDHSGDPGNGGGCLPGTTVNARATADPNGQVPLGTTVQVTASADSYTVRKDCSRTVHHVDTGTWSLTFQAPFSAETDATGILSSTTGLWTSFVAASEGIYRARFEARVGLNAADATVLIVAGVISLAPQRILEASSLSGPPAHNDRRHRQFERC